MHNKNDHIGNQTRAAGLMHWFWSVWLQMCNAMAHDKPYVYTGSKGIEETINKIWEKYLPDIYRF